MRKTRSWNAKVSQFSSWKLKSFLKPPFHHRQATCHYRHKDIDCYLCQISLGHTLPMSLDNLKLFCTDDHLSKVLVSYSFGYHLNQANIQVSQISPTVRLFFQNLGDLIQWQLVSLWPHPRNHPLITLQISLKQIRNIYECLYAWSILVDSGHIEGNWKEIISAFKKLNTQKHQLLYTHLLFL